MILGYLVTPCVWIWMRMRMWMVKGPEREKEGGRGERRISMFSQSKYLPFSWTLFCIESESLVSLYFISTLKCHIGNFFYSFQLSSSHCLLSWCLLSSMMRELCHCLSWRQLEKLSLTRDNWNEDEYKGLPCKNLRCARGHLTLSLSLPLSSFISILLFVWIENSSSSTHTCSITALGSHLYLATRRNNSSPFHNKHSSPSLFWLVCLLWIKFADGKCNLGLHPCDGWSGCFGWIKCHSTQVDTRKVKSLLLIWLETRNTKHESFNPGQRNCERMKFHSSFCH